MLVAYNDVVLEMVRTKDWTVRAHWNEDNTEVLWFHHLMSFETLFNPAVNPIMGAWAGTTLTTKALLHQKLLEPQKKLVIFDQAGGQGLKLPLDGFTVDANWGPHPLAVAVHSVIGTKSMVVYWTCEAFEPVNCTDKDVSVISHRWEMSEDIDEFYYRRRTITGRAIFRTDRLLKSGRVPDDFRARLFHPCPDDHRRVAINVVQESSGNAIRYTVVDQQVPVNVGKDGGIVLKIEGQYKQGFSDDNFIGFANRYNSVLIQVWGKPNDYSRRGLVNAALKAAIPYGFPHGMDTGNLDPGFSADLTIDLTRPYVEFRSSFLTGGKIIRSLRDQERFTIWDNFPDNDLRNPGILAGVVYPGKLPGELVEDFYPGWETLAKAQAGDPDALARLANRRPHDAPAPPNGIPKDNPLPPHHGCRTVLEKLVAQAINGLCAVPVDPAKRVGDDKQWAFS